jgi:hypothetical protein
MVTVQVTGAVVAAGLTHAIVAWSLVPRRFFRAVAQECTS